MAMDRDAARAYNYAKISGMLSKSYTGNRAAKLFTAQTVKELWSFVFSKEAPAVPEKLLANELEKEAERSFISEYIDLVSNFTHPENLLTLLLHSFEYDNLKQIGAALLFKEEKMPDIVDVAPYNILDYSKWPDISLMTQDTVLSWYNKIPSLKEQQQYDAKLDAQFIKEIWSAANEVSNGKEDICKILALKFSMENIVWALRLKVYYKMQKEEILSHLTFVNRVHSVHDPIAGAAVEILDWDIADYDQWEKWKYKKLLNPYEETGLWQIDPRWIYNESRKLVVERAQKLFRQNPFSICPIVCWYLIKENELDVIRTAAECIRMGENQEKAMSLAGVTEEING